MGRLGQQVTPRRWAVGPLVPGDLRGTLVGQTSRVGPGAAAKGGRGGSARVHNSDKSREHLFRTCSQCASVSDDVSSARAL